MSASKNNNLSAAEQELYTKLLQQARAKKSGPQSIPPLPEGVPPVLSFAQQRLWFLYQWEPESPAYNILLALRLQGRLDEEALRRALGEIVRRHTVLQMVFVIRDEEPTLAVHPNPTLALEVVSLESLPPETRLAEAQRLANLDALKPFDIEHDLPLRAFLFRLGAQEHVLLLNMHHIASDGWSVAVLTKELVALYEAFSSGKPSPLAELPIQYTDFAAWQRDWLQGEVLEKQLSFWKRQLAGAPTVLELPTDRPRPAVSTHNGAIHAFCLPQPLAREIRALSQNEGVTPFMTLLAAFETLLYRYTGQKDIVIGSPIANRNRSEIEALIGFFINTLLIRADLSGAPSVRELLSRVREVTLEAYEHQDMPFEKLVEELHPQRTLSHNPLFQVMFNLQNAPRADLELPGLTIEPLNLDAAASKFDLNIHIEEVGEGLEGTITYNTDLFDGETIRRMAGHYQTLLEGFVSDPAQRLDDLQILTPQEAQQIRVWSDTRQDYEDVVCLQQMFEQQAARFPERAAVFVDEASYTYRELNEKANQIAHYLQSLGVGPDVRVGLFMERSLDTMAALLGILKAGGAYVPIDPIYPPDRVRFMLDDVQVRMLLTQSHLAANLPDLGDLKVLCLDQDAEQFGSQSKENPVSAVTLSNLMYVLFTSGSTGRPKGVAVEHRNYLNYFHGIVRRLPLEPGMSFAMVSTFATDLGTITFWGAFYVGGTVYIASYERATDPETLADYYRRHPIDVLKLVPSHLEALLGGSDPAAIVPRKLLIITGEASYWDTVRKVRAYNPGLVIQDHYGVTETTCATLVYQAPEEIPAQTGGMLPKGFPLGNVRIHILDSQMRPTPIGVPGELFIGGAGVTRGYVNRPELTAEKYIPDPFVDPRPSLQAAHLYRTGDLACYQPDGTMKLLGRMDFQVKIRGYRIELGEIETLLGQHPSVQDAVVIARRDNGEDRLVAYVAPRLEWDGRFSVNDLRDALRQSLPEYMVPTAFVTLEKIPLNPNGKVDRFALPVPDQASLSYEGHFVAPRNEIEQRMADIWSEVLKNDKVGIDDNFFDLGGDSFKAIRVVRKIGEAASAMALFKYPTIRQLGEHLAPGMGQSDNLLHELTRPVSAASKVLNLVCIPYGGGSGIMYQLLANALPKDFSLYALEIPGHDYSRPDEALQPLEEVARCCVEEIKRDLTGPIALYGHCVGGALAIEIARRLEAEQIEMAGIFLGGHFPVARLPGKLFEWLHKIFPSDRWTPSRNIYEGLRVLGGFTDLLDHQEQEFMLRSLRHDVREAEDYYTEAYANRERGKLNTPILCLVGQKDRSTEFYSEEYKEWETFSHSVDLAVIPQAGHYFLKHQAGELAGILQKQASIWKPDAVQAGAAAGALAAPGDEHAQQRKPEGHAWIASTAQVQTAKPSLRTFFIVVFGQLISLIGTGLTSFALGVWVYNQTGSVTMLATILVFAFLPGIVVLPVAGALADRWDRRLIMLLSDILAACGVMALAALLWTDRLQTWHIYAIASVGSIASAFQRPAYIAAITQLVPKRYLGHANGITQFGLAAGDLLSPLLGGLLVMSIGLPGIVLLDSISFLFAILTLLFVRFPNALFHKQEEPFLKALTSGWHYIVRRPGLVAMVIFFVVFNYLIAIVNVVPTPLVLSFGTPALLGVIFACSGAGVLAGSLVMSLWGGTRRRAEGMVGFVTLFGLSVIVMGLRPSPVAVALGLFGVGFALTITNAHWLSLIQLKVGLELQGRVASMNQMLGWSMIPLGFITAGPLIEKIFEPLMATGGPLAGSVGRLIGSGPGRGMGLLMIVVGTLYLLLGIAGYRYKPLRFMEDALPDAVPDAVILDDKDELQKRADHQLLSEVN